MKQTQQKTGKTKLKLINATLESLMAKGMDGCSVRKISLRADVSTGLINYHYPTINHLVADAYRHLASDFLQQAVSKSIKHAAQPRLQMSIFLNEIFSQQVMQKRVLRAWVVFWGLIDSTPEMQAAHKSSSGSYTEYMTEIFDQLLAPQTASKAKLISPKMAAIGLNSMIDGLWLEWCLQTDVFTPGDCITLCEHWVDSLDC